MNFLLIKGDLLNTDEIDVALDKEAVLEYLKLGEIQSKLVFGKVYKVKNQCYIQSCLLNM